MNKYYKSGSFIVEMRKIKGLSQNDISKKLNVTRKAVSRWENGWGLPDSSLLLPLAQILGVTVDEILMGELSANKDLSPEQIQTIEEINSFLKYKSEKKRVVQNLIVYIPIALASLIGIVVSNEGTNQGTNQGSLAAMDYMSINDNSFVRLLSGVALFIIFFLLLYDISRFFLYWKKQKNN